MTTTPIPTLDAWLKLWRPTRNGSGNFTATVGRERYLVFQNPSGGWGGRIGATFAPGAWGTAEDAQRGLHRVVSTMSPEELWVAHYEPGERRPRAFIPDPKSTDSEPSLFDAAPQSADTLVANQLRDIARTIIATADRLDARSRRN